MFSIIAAFLLLILPVPDGPSDLVLPVEGVSIEQIEQDLFSVVVPGFSSTSLEDGLIFLPEKTVMIPIPPGEQFSVRVVPSGVTSLGAVPAIAAVEFNENGEEVFITADLSRIRSGWGEVSDSGTFRRAGYIAVCIRPVVVQNGELLQATSLSIQLNCDTSFRAETVPGHEGEIFRSLFDTNAVWRTPLLSRADSPFYGKPWSRIKVDTAGVYEITADLIPEAVGMPSASFSMITGRGRMMRTDDPSEDAFVPRSVPVYIDDGGDGIFDSTDRVIFYGRGLAWWGAFQSDHFNSMYDSLNTYWLTWGGQGGSFMNILDGSVTGAPSGGTGYTGRHHFEQNQVLTYAMNVFDDMFAWHMISSSDQTTAYYHFTCSEITGNGTMRINLSIVEGGNLALTAALNGAAMADTVRNIAGAIFWEFPVSGLKKGNNTLALKIESAFTTRSPFKVYTNWFEVFPETGFDSQDPQCQVPLGNSFPGGERRLISWSNELDAESFVCVVLSDTAVVRINIPGGKNFEIDMPSSWHEPVMWVIPDGDFRKPVSVAASSPGRIIGTLSSGSTVYIYPDLYASDMPLFARGRSDAIFVSLTDIYDEFNGGVRDPGAVRAFFDYALNHWSKAPDQLILVGSGHYDPRGFTTSKPSPMDVIIYRFQSANTLCSDFLYSVTGNSILPQAAVSRIAVHDRSELQLVAQRSNEYSDISQECGTWQSVIIGAADDERTPKNPNGDETYHTDDMEKIMATVIPDRFIPLRQYLINWEWNSNWKKPEARKAYIENWSKGALVSFFLGHGGFDQLADEGLLFIEDVDLLSCGPRLPYSFFGSCNVGVFQNPSHDCIARRVTVAPGGGAIVATGASCSSFGVANADYLTKTLSHLLSESSESQYSIGESQWLGLLDGGFNSNDKVYIVFGDGSLHLALPDSGFSVADPGMFTSELCEIDGFMDRDGLVMLTAWESAVVDSYYTHNSSYLIEYLSAPGVFYRGLAEASPDFTAEMFIPSFAQQGDLGRVRYFSPGGIAGSLACSYPVPVVAGSSSGDNTGPDMELWLSGFRGDEHPSISVDAVFEAILKDSSGINLLPFAGVQLVLYIDDSPVDVSEYFTYDLGSATSGRIVYPLPELQPGDHTIRLRAADNAANISWDEITFNTTDSHYPEIDHFFVHPTPASAVVSLNWTQSMNGPISISIFSVSGSEIISFGNLSGRSGYNQHNWNLCDADGDMVASGSYIYLVSAGSSEETGIIIVVR